jgi:hypothetical protein
MPTTQANRHSKKIAILEQEQIEHFKIISSIDRKLSDEFFNKVNGMYDYIVVGNGTPSLKAWRQEIDKERGERKEDEKDGRSERRRWLLGIFIFSLGVATNILLGYI